MILSEEDKKKLSEEDKNKLSAIIDRELFIANNKVVVKTIDYCVRRILSNRLYISDVLRRKTTYSMLENYIKICTSLVCRTVTTSSRFCILVLNSMKILT